LGLNKAEDEVLTADLYVSAMPVDPEGDAESVETDGILPKT